MLSRKNKNGKIITIWNKEIKLLANRQDYCKST